MVSGTNLRALFSQRKKRSNAGIKRGPRKAKTLAPSNVIVVNNGGVAHVEAPRVPKGRGRAVGPMFIGPLRPQNTRKVRKTRSNAGVKRAVETANLLGLAGMKIVGQRKTRKNKGVKRGPRHFPRNTNLFN